MPSKKKPSNPKDIIGSDKIPYHLWPETASMLGALGLLDGALKYGRSNFRVVGVKLTIYLDAIRRHSARMLEGQWVDEDSGLPHLSHILASAAIIADADAARKLTNDANVKGGYHELLEEMTPHVKRLKKLYKGKKPKHYTIADRVK